ncbi:UNVERIFIED_CONTAM: hypothetical protein HDU68_002633 [Siphonaria sp. JEL0065]|nr:hypothetical protein HDU68_002633 [Siphonaria sp. JEL0065]
MIGKVIDVEDLLKDLDESLSKLVSGEEVGSKGEKELPRVPELLNSSKSSSIASAELGGMNRQMLKESRTVDQPAAKATQDPINVNISSLSEPLNTLETAEMQQHRFSQKSWLSNASHDEFNAKYAIPLSLQGMCPYENDLEYEEYFDSDSDDGVLVDSVVKPQMHDDSRNNSGNMEYRQSEHLALPSNATQFLLPPPAPPPRQLIPAPSQTLPKKTSVRLPKKLPPIPITSK